MKKENFMICSECGNVYKLTRYNDGLPCKKCGSKRVTPCNVGIDLAKGKDFTAIGGKTI